jgi:hypothetical protein
MASATANTYKYERLNGARDIRLITLCPGVGDETILLNIEHASLDQRPAYEALSYVWGPQNPSHPVQCDNASLAVGGNLRDALRCLRKPDAPRVLWIDRIAINQEDMDERAQQVGLMGDIYSSASLVVIWLGTADDSTEPAIGLLNDLGGQMLEYMKIQKLKSYAEAQTVKDPFQYPPLEAPVWPAVRSLLQRPWFSRVWTFQEIVLAQEAVLYCGAHTLRWMRLEVFLLGLSTFPQGPNTEDSRLQGAEVDALEIFKARSILHRPKNHKPEDNQLFLGLFPLLDSLRLRQATDPRDKVFALLNVAYDAKHSDLKADYRKSHAEVYAMTAKWLLRTQKRLDFLSLIEKKDKPDLISWVPDFRYKDPWNFLHQPRQIFRGNYRVYNTSGSTNATIIDIESNYQLTVSGIYVGTVVDRTMPPGNLTNNLAIGAAVLDGGQWHLFARTCAVNGVYPATGEPIDLAYHRLRIWDQLPTEGLLYRRQRTSLITQVPQPGPISYDYAKDAIVHSVKGDIGISILSKTTRKRMFKTETGYLGIAHRSVEIGDKVYVLMGGEMPFVLRPFGGNYFGFGGESYVHGIMDGEMLAVARANREDLKSVDTNDLAWIDNLGDEPWPFATEKLILV